MVFSSIVFLWVFLPLVFVINLFMAGRLSNVFLLLASLIFYAWGEPQLVVLMMASILVNWLAGKLIGKYGGHKKGILAAAVVIDLSLLGYFKYAGFLAGAVNTLAGGTVIRVPDIRLPIGISFFTFQAISYVADVYRGETQAQDKLVNTALYISFFPQLIAGPIVRYHDINLQLENRHITWEKVAEGFRRFVYGLSKKVLISNVLGACTDQIYALEPGAITGAMAWLAAVCYMFQIYYDFSGYSDMAIGLGKMFGFDFPENFNYPYISHSVREFWRRWHISLSTWFREYVYIPLGGNRKGNRRTYVNLLIVFFLTGLWHGAGWNYILWGLYHGFFLVIERVFTAMKARTANTHMESETANTHMESGTAGNRRDKTFQSLSEPGEEKGEIGNAGTKRLGGKTGEFHEEGVSAGQFHAKKIFTGVFSFVYTFLTVNIGWVFFRTGTRTALSLIARMVMPWRYGGAGLSLWEYADYKTFFILACAALGMGWIQSLIPKRIKEAWRFSLPEALWCAVMLVLCIASIASDTYNPFIYFQF